MSKPVHSTKRGGQTKAPNPINLEQAAVNVLTPNNSLKIPISNSSEIMSMMTAIQALSLRVENLAGMMA
ncbi:unnamed protein product [Gordionus sp. m RMFG-2023]